MDGAPSGSESAQVWAGRVAGVVGEGSPEVVEEGGVSGGADVVEDGLEGGVGGDFGVGSEGTVGMQ